MTTYKDTWLIKMPEKEWLLYDKFFYWKNASEAPNLKHETSIFDAF